METTKTPAESSAPATGSQKAPTLASTLVEHTDELVHRWYEAWRASTHPRPEVGEAALKDLLPLQLKVIGEQLANPAQAEDTERMWMIAERLDPEKRLDEAIPVEEIVKEYLLVVAVARAWIREWRVEVS